MDGPTASRIWCIGVAIGLAASNVAAAQERPADINVVVNNSQVPPRILDLALVEAGRLYRLIGVKATRHGGDISKVDDSTTGTGFTIRLIVQPWRGSDDKGSRSIMGAALPSKGDRGTIYVFNDRVADQASWRGTDMALLMGLVIAHEIGHVLLRHSEHPAGGLMRGVWDADDIQRAASGRLWFSPSEAATIRTTLSRCCP